MIESVGVPQSLSDAVHHCVSLIRMRPLFLRVYTFLMKFDTVCNHTGLGGLDFIVVSQTR